MKKQFWSTILVLLCATQLHAVSLNDAGRVAHGVGGTTTGVDNRALAQGGGANASRWFDASHIIFQRADTQKLALVDTAGVVTDAAPMGANTVKAHGGTWAAWLAGTGLYTSTGWLLPDAGLLDVGPDGEVAYTPVYQAGRGAVVRYRDGREVTLVGDDWVIDLELLGGTKAVWSNGIVIQTTGLPAVTMAAPRIWRPRAANVNGEWWIVYWTDTRGLIAHPFTSTRGYVVRTTPDAFAHDAMGLGHTLRVAFATNEAESAGSIIVKDINVDTEPRVDLTPAAPPVPTPLPTPTPAPGLASLPAEVCATLREARGTGPITSNDQLGAILNRVAWTHRAQGFGLNSKTAGNFCASPAGNVACDILHRKSDNLMFDVFGSAGPGEPTTVQCGESIGENGNSSRPWVAPVDPGGASPTPAPTPTPAPNYDAQIAALQAKLNALDARINEVHSADWNAIQDVDNRLSKRIDDSNNDAHLRALVADLMARAVVSGKTRVAFGHQHLVELGITIK